jgi:FG-GAP-like repeat
MLSGTPPTIIQAGVLPVTGSNTSATPALQVEFSDSMTNSALNVNNYVLLGSSGTLVPITNVSFVAGTSPSNDEVQLTYNSGNPGNVLVVDTYTLYVRGNNLISASSGLAVAQPGQLFAANSGRNQISVANIPGTSGLGATSNYSVPFTSPTPALADAVALADVNGDGIPDLIVADGGSSEVNIYAGQSAAQGGGYNATPSITLALPATVASAESIALGDFNGATFPTGAPELSIAVATTNADTVTVFLNTSSAVGVTSFAAGTSYSVDFDPVGITAGDFDGDGNIDLAVAIDAATSAPIGTYRLDILPGTGTGLFGAVAQVAVGDTTPTGLTTPSCIASGVFQAGALPTLVVGGSDGLEVLQNTSAPGTFTFTATPFLSTNAIDSVAVGSLSSGGENSIAALTGVNTVEVYQSNGSGGFAPVYSQAVASGTAGQIAIGNLNKNGDGDIVVTNAGATGSVAVLKNLTVGGTVISASRTTGNPIVVNAPGNNLVNGQFVTITGNTFSGANVTGNAITILGNTISSIVAAAGTVTVTTTTSGSLYGLVAGDTVTITGTNVADGTFTLTNVNVAGNTFTYIDGTVTGNASNTGSWTDPAKFILTGTSGATGNGTGGTWARVGNITAANEVGGVAPIVVTSPSNGLVSGDRVTVAGIPGFASASGTNTITVLGSAITQASIATSGVVTITAASAYGLANGDNIVISGNSLAVANGTWTITGIGGNTFTFSNPGATTVGAIGVGGAWTSPDKFTLDGNNSAGASSAAGGTFTTQTSFSTGAAIDYSTGTAMTATVTNGSARVTNLISTAGLSVGMAVNGTGIPVGATIASIDSNSSFLLSANASSGGTQVLTFATSYSTDGDPIGVAVGDTNGDGNADVVTANDGASANDVTLLLGRGDASLQSPANITVPSANSLQNIVTADLNGDGIPDIIIANNANGTGNTKITIYQGLGNGQYASGVSISPGNVQNIVGIAVGHFSNANGSSASFPDIVYADGSDNTIGFLQNKITVAGTTITSAGFTASSTVNTGASAGLTSLAVGDFNNDGLTDVIVSGQFPNSGGHHGSTQPAVAVLINTSSNASNFQFSASQHDTNIGTISSIAVGDFNNDGNLDFVAAVNAAPGEVIFNTGDGKGNFSSGTTFPTGVPNAVSIAVGDFNNDGYKDVVVASSSTAGTNSGVAVLLNQVGTGFGTPIVTAVAPGTPLKSVVIDDINGDGLPDVVVSTAPFSGSITGTSASGTTPITIDTNSINGLSPGMTVTIYGVQGDTAANGTWTIGAVNGGHAPNFTILGSTANANYTSGGTWVVGNTQDNVFLLIGNGAGAFGAPAPYLVGPTGLPLPAPTYLAITPTPLQAVTTFTSGGNLVQPNLINNGDFESRDLSGEQGNLLGWQTYDDPYGSGSAGAWGPQTGSTSPLSNTTVHAPVGNFQAMLDEPNVIPILPANTAGNMNAINSNTVASYSGGHALYQDVTIPANASAANFSMSLYINNTGLGVTGAGGYSDSSANPSLNFNTAAANQQVRVDILAVNLITAASNAGPIVITSANDGLTSGQQVTISGVQGNTAANGTWFIKTINANQFSLYANYNPSTATFSNPSAGNGTYVANTGEWTQNFLSVNSTGSGPDHVLQQLFQTYPAGSAVPSVPFTTDLATYSGVITANLVQFAGKTVRVRIAAANNQGPLIVGVDSVKLDAKFTDSTTPKLTNVAVNNPSFVTGGIPYTNDPTITGTIGAPYGLSSIAYVAFDPTNGNFISSSVTKTTQWDATGHFSYTLPAAVPGLNTIGIEVVDRAGNVSKTTFSFFLQTNSVTQWSPIGPQGIDVTGQGVNYTKVSGRITATVADSLDPTGNTYLVGTPNGGIWRTTDGGNNWTAVTSNVTNGSGTPISVGVGAMAQAPGNPNVIYAGTGVGDDQLDSLAGVGILKSVNDGLTWTLLAGSVATFNGARITAMVVDPNDPTGKIVFAAVASGGAGPGVYRSTDGGNTWTNITSPATNMYETVAPNYLPFDTGSPLIGGTLGSVTSMVINPYNTFGELIIGIGNIGLGVAASLTGGVWITTNAYTATPANVSWAQVVGNNGNALVPGAIPNDGLPTGTGLGRVTVAIGGGTSTQDKYLYVLIANPDTVPPTAPSLVDYGSGIAGNNILATNQAVSGLYKSSDNGLDFTQVALMQNIGMFLGVGLQNHNFVDINLLGEDGDNAGTLLVDPTDPNAVFVGGSNFYNQSGVTDHAFIYVDTGDMLDYDTKDANGIIDNNGDDIQKYNTALADGFDYDPINLGDPYQGEGVYWYDMIEGQSGKNGKLTQLPGEITSMTVDSQGRLLIGTVGGIWRGVNNGFGYDFTSGNTGILNGSGHHAAPTFAPPAMSFTSINGNLQISDMTSVAIDPDIVGSFFTTQVDTGVASYNPTDGWVSQGLSGPTNSSGVDLGIPTAVSILSATTATGSVNLYRIWEYANTGALLPEVSTDDGATWQAISAVPGGVSASLIPAFAINPTVIYSGNPALPFNQLLFGSSDPVVTVDSSNTWNAVGTPAGLAAGALPTAAAIAQSNDQAYYIGDNQGEIWVTTSGGGGSGSWTLAAGAASGLPAVSLNSPVEGIAVNPTNPAIVFAMYGGTGSTTHVYKSTNTGVSFSPINGPWGSAQAYSMVIDPTPALGAPSGKIYLATQVGVYVSINGGSNWSVLGQGMPNVPVVDLSYNASLQTLAAATLGRGVFTINTAAISVIPTQTINENTASAVIPFTVNDTGGASYTIKATSSNPNLIANTASAIVIGGSGANRTIKFTPSLNAYNTPVNGQGGPGVGNWQGPNTETITLTLTSGSGSNAFSFQQSFIVTVDFVNSFPTVTTPGNVTILPNQPSSALPITVGDFETPAGALVLQASSNNQTLIPNANLALGGVASITAASWSANTVTIMAPNTFSAGQKVVIAGMTPAGYNGVFTIATANATSFTYTLSVNPGEPGGTTPITAANWASNVATITAANTFTAGQTVVITGMTPSGYNGTYTIASATPTDFTYALGASQVSATGFGTATLTGAPLGTATTANRTLTITPVALPITAATWSAGTASITAANSFSAGQTVVIAGVTPTGYDGMFLITGANATSFTYALPSDPGGNGATFGTASPAGSAIITLTVTDGNGGITQNTVNVLVTSPVTLPFSDSFNTPPSSVFAGPGWNTNVGATPRVNSEIVPSATTTANVATLNGVTQNNIALQADISVGAASGQYAGLVARYGGTGDTNMYFAAIQSTGSGYKAIIKKNVHGVWTVLSSVAVPNAVSAVPISITGASWNAGIVTITAANDFTAGQSVVISGMTPTGYNGTFTILTATSSSFTYARTKNPGTATVFGNAAVLGVGTLFFEVAGYSLQLYFGPTGTAAPTLLTYAFDSSLTTGSAGFRMSGSASGATHLDNFAAAAIPTPSSQSVSFSDNFGTPGTYYTNSNSSGQLDANWVGANGDFHDTGSAAVGAGAVNLATVAGLNAGDVSVSATATLAVGQYAGLVSRYSGPLSKNFYWAAIYQVSATKIETLIYKNVGGVMTLISTPQFVTVTSLTNSLEFQTEGSSLKLFLTNGGNTVLIGYAEDSSLTSGSVGVMTHGAAALAGFQSNPVTSTAQSVGFGDNFTPGTPGNQLDTNTWEEQAGNFNISTGSAVGVGAVNLATVIGLNAGDVSVSANVTLAVGQYAGLVSRYSGPLSKNLYWGAVYQLNATQIKALIYKNVGGVMTLISTPQIFSDPANTSGPLVFQTEGTSLKLFYNNTLVAYAHDSSLTSGSVGMRTTGTAAVANFLTSALGVPQSTTFTDPLTTGSGPSNNQLNSSSWTEQAGNFTVGSSGATGQAPVNLATVYGLSYADQTLETSIAFNAANQSAGLVARYSGPLNQNYYYASVTSVDSTGTTVKVQLWKNVHGTLIALTGPKTVTGFAGDLDFTVIGNTLTLSTDGVNQQFSITDNSITGAGLAGIRASAGATVSNFSAS